MGTGKMGKRPGAAGLGGMERRQGDVAAPAVARARYAIVAAEYNDFVVAKLVEGAVSALRGAGVPDGNLRLVRVPGAFELPLAAARVLGLGDRAGGGVDAVIALGAVIRGDTPHFDYVAGECARGLARLSLDSGKPVAFGVLTVDTVEQALDRAQADAPGGATGEGHARGDLDQAAWEGKRPVGNKGAEAARTAMEMLSLLRCLDAAADCRAGEEQEKGKEADLGQAAGVKPSAGNAAGKA